MNTDRDKMAERILHLTLEILFQLTGEEYTVVRKTSSGRCQTPVSEGLERPLSPITGPPSFPLIHEDINDQKILDLTYKMIELLTGEVPIRSQDVTVYLSMEEWECLKEHKDLYKDVMMKVPQAVTSPGLSSERTTPEKCPRPLLLQDGKPEDPDVPQDHQGEDLLHINPTETHVRGDERSKEEIPTDNCTDDCTRSSEGRLIFLDSADNLGITLDTCAEHVIVPDTSEDLLRKNLSSAPSQQVLFTDLSKANMQKRRAVEHEMAYTGEKPFSCSECGKCFDTKLGLEIHQRNHRLKKSYSCSKCGICFTTKLSLVTHQRTHTGEKPFSCSVCGKFFQDKSYLVIHQRIHTGEKPFSCSVCGKRYSNKSNLVNHQRNHTGEKAFSCSECGKCFTDKSCLVKHQIIHSGEKPFSCSECEKCFNRKANLVKHVRIHTGEKPYSCLECGKRYSEKCRLIEHKRTHTGEKPFSCSECGKCYSEKSKLVTHQRTHTGEKPYSCPECGKCFTERTNLIPHLRIHTGEKPFSCSECGKCFRWRSMLIKHQRSHTGETILKNPTV